MAKRVQKDRVPYDVWVRNNFIEATQGNVVDYEVLRRRIREDGERFNIRQIAYDRWNSEKFRTACGPDWNMPDNADLWRCAFFEEGVITAIAGYRSWSDIAGDPCVITRPDARSGGRGAAVTAAVVAEALRNGKLLLYQTLKSNHPAVRIALSLGYDQYASHLAVRLRRQYPGP